MAMNTRLDIDQSPAKARTVEAPWGYKADGVTPRARPGRQAKPQPSTVPSAAHAAPPLRRENPRPVPREQTRELAREPSRANASVVGRDGEELTRMRPEAGGDMYEKVKCPDPDYVYQWNTVSTLGKEMDEQELQMFANGWRPVPASRHPGVYSAPGYEGQIVVKGLRLEERPKVLNDEALYEDKMRAQQQTRDQTDALRLTQAKLPGAQVGARGNRVAIDVNPRFTADIPRPAHMIDEE